MPPSNLLKPVKLSPQQTLDLEYIRCANDFYYWLKHYGGMKGEDGAPNIGPGITLWPGQREHVELYASDDDVIDLKARQIGLSQIATNYDCWDFMFHPNVGLAVIAQDDDLSMEHLARLRWLYEEQPPHLRRAVPVVGKDNKHELGLSNGSRCVALPCTASKIRGLTVKRVRLEEFAYWPNAKNAYAAIVGAAGDSRRSIKIISTADGEGGEYHRLWQGAEAGTLAIKPFFLGWRTKPDRDDAWYAEKAKTLGPLVKQEYPATADEAFLASGTKYFDVEDLRRLEARHGMQPLRIMFGAAGIGEGAKLAGLHIGLRIYAEPVPGRSYVIGADTADGGGDACSATVLDAETGEQMAQYISYTDRSGQFGDALAAIGRTYNMALIGCEINNTGHGTCVALEKQNYPNLYRRPDGEMHWRTSDATREPLLDAYRTAVSDGELTIHDRECYRQARIFCNVKGKWQHPEGDHDDCVFAPAIAQQTRLQALAQRQCNAPPPVYLGNQRIA